MSEVTKYDLATQERTKINRSKYRDQLIFKSGVHSYTNPGTETSKTITINHNLGFVPSFEVYLSEDDQNFRRIPYDYDGTVSDPNTEYVYYQYKAVINTTQLIITITTYTVNFTAYNPDAVFKYYIYREKAT